MKRLLVLACLLTVALSGCATTYTEADLKKDEAREDAASIAGDARDEQIGEQGGQNEAAEDDESEYIDQDSEL